MIADEELAALTERERSCISNDINNYLRNGVPAVFLELRRLEYVDNQPAVIYNRDAHIAAFLANAPVDQRPAIRSDLQEWLDREFGIQFLTLDREGRISHSEQHHKSVLLANVSLEHRGRLSNEIDRMVTSGYEIQFLRLSPDSVYYDLNAVEEAITIAFWKNRRAPSSTPYTA